MKPGILAIALALAATSVQAQDARRQLDAHAHGEGRLSIAIEGGRIQVELEAPANDIVGFEHAPGNATQKKAISDAKARLAKFSPVVKLPADAACKLASAKVEVLGAAGEAGKSGHTHSHKGHSHDTPTGKAPKNTEGDKAGATDAHSEFRAVYELDCAAPANLKSLAFEYFKSFKGAERLAVTVIGPKGQSQSEVTRAKPVLDLAGVS